jgi:hypothetical protein
MACTCCEAFAQAPLPSRLIERGREAQWRPCKLAPEPLKDVSSWLEQYRRFWVESFDRLDAYLIPSALGSVPEKVDYDFEPLEAPDADKDAARFKTVAEALNIIAGLGTMPEQAFNEAATRIVPPTNGGS